MKVHFNIRVTGRVQGVFYRASARAMAVSLGLVGFVRNEPDGSVYAEAEGNTREVQQFIAWCRKGPAGARVENIYTTQGEVKGFREFTIER